MVVLHCNRRIGARERRQLVPHVRFQVPGDLVRTVHRQLAADRFPRVRGRDRDVVDE